MAITSYFGRNRNCVKLLGYIDEPMIIVLKFYPISLATWIKSTLDEDRNLPAVKSLSSDIINGLNSLHLAEFSHNDIKVGKTLTNSSLTTL